MTSRPRWDRGFTIIELTVVIILLSVLGVYAIPRMVDLKDDAYRGSAGDFKASLAAGVAMAHGKWMASNRSGQLTLPGGQVTYFNAEGFPVSTNGDRTVKGQNGNCVAVANSVLNGPNVIDKTFVDVGGDPRPFKWCVKAGFYNWQTNDGQDVCNFTMIKVKSSTLTSTCYPSGPTDQVITYHPVTGLVEASGL